VGVLSRLGSAKACRRIARSTAYDEKNRQTLVNETQRPDVSSRTPNVVKNADGTTDVYVGAFDVTPGV
jgi:hypothetical protein